METSVKSPVVVCDAKKRLDDIILSVSWLEIAETYFGRSSSWLYQKLNGIKSDGSKGGGFTREEAAQLAEALNDTADRIRKAASSLYT